MSSSSKAVTTNNKYRTHTNGELTKEHADQTVRLSGWVHTRRDHGGLIFIDLRDRWGITQLTFDPSKQKTAWQQAEDLRSEYVIQINGTVRRRPPDMVNSNIATGEIEVLVNHLTILSQAKALPFAIDADTAINEELRLKYRFLDLRRPYLQKMLRRRDEFIAHVRHYMKNQGFTEVQTPILANSSPEGARDFLVPSRLHPGKFYALPQAPQQYKQLLMVAGVDRYFQIAPCFRDEDPRADRHSGAFYQIDMEMSFVEQEDVWAVIEPLMIELTEDFSEKTIVTKPFPRIPWREAMAKYGSDKPDLRYDLFITDVSQEVSNSDFKVFSDVLKDDGHVMALPVPGGADFTRSQIDSLTEVAKGHGAKGLAYILYRDKLESPIIKHLGEDIAQAVADKVNAKPGDAIFFSATNWEHAARFLGAIRVAAAAMLNLADDNKAAWVWITDFPMYELNDEGKIDFSHNPFSMPQGGLAALAADDPTTILGYQYDLALNGYEISSGAIRNHDPQIMYKAFAIAGYDQKTVDEKFGGMIRAFEYGAPPHGGFAPGIDRLMMVLWGIESIRDIYAFPKNGRAQDTMMGAPSPVSQDQLKELHLSLDLDE